MAEDNWWASSPFATAASAKGPTGGGVKAKTTPQDMIELREASGKAQSERDARRGYRSTQRAVEDMDTGPWKARWLDMITPDQDGGVMDTIGSVLGSVARPFISERTLAARDQMNTVSAQTALQGSQMMKGSSSDKDTLLMRTAGISPYKTKQENLRILKSAERDSGLAQARAQTKSWWISKFGSMAQPSPNGTTYEQAMSLTDRHFMDQYSRSQRPAPRRAPPSARSKGSGRTVIDLNGTPIR